MPESSSQPPHHVPEIVIWDTDTILLSFHLSFSHSHRSSTGRASLLQALPPEEAAADPALALGLLVGQRGVGVVLLPRAGNRKMTERKLFRRPA